MADYGGGFGDPRRWKAESDDLDVRYHLPPHLVEALDRIIKRAERRGYARAFAHDKWPEE